MKLEKMVYYAQAYCLVTYGTALFDEDFQEWVTVPVSPVLYQTHKGRFLLHPGDLSTSVEGHAPPDRHTVERIDPVCSALYGLTANELTKRARSEEPWIEASSGYGPSDFCDVAISKESMRRYYSAHPILARA